MCAEWDWDIEKADGCMTLKSKYGLDHTENFEFYSERIAIVLSKGVKL